MWAQSPSGHVSPTRDISRYSCDASAITNSSSCGDRRGHADPGIDISIADNRVRPQPSYTFSGGARRCLGVHLARAELIAIITEFLRRIPEFRTADGYSVLAAEVDRYLTHLPLVW
jgi:hypothetical protein